eukprot:3882216-Pleurochrysis_carterae.AAC.1
MCTSCTLAGLAAAANMCEHIMLCVEQPPQEHARSHFISFTAPSRMVTFRLALCAASAPAVCASEWMSWKVTTVKAGTPVVERATGGS